MKEYCGETFTKIQRDGEEISGLLFEDCLFEQCRFTELTVKNCQFSGCRFEGCKIAAPKLKGSQMLSCDFHQCDLSGIDWSSLLDERKREMGFLPFDGFTECSIRHCLFFGMDLKEFLFSGTDLTGSCFDSCQLEKADFMLSFTIVSSNSNIKGGMGYERSIKKHV